jgi:hypothetical protein
MPAGLLRSRTVPLLWRVGNGYRRLCKKPGQLLRSGGIAQLDKYFETQTGNHGFDPRLVPEMNGTLYGIGPNIKTGARIGPVQNIEIHPLIANILGLEIDRKIDAGGQLAKASYRW